MSIVERSKKTVTRRAAAKSLIFIITLSIWNRVLQGRGSNDRLKRHYHAGAVELQSRRLIRTPAEWGGYITLKEWWSIISGTARKLKHLTTAPSGFI
jgi:hypothetical protein